MRTDIVAAQLLLWMLLVVTTTDALTIHPDYRVELFRPARNNITLSCRVNAVPIHKLDFWVNSTENDLTLILSNYSKSMDEISFLMYPAIEGMYYCGNISAGIMSSNNFTLTGKLNFLVAIKKGYLPCILTSPAYPVVSTSVSPCYTAEIGENVMLQCPFTRGALSQHYSYLWKMEIFKQMMLHSLPYLGNDSSPYLGNDTDFSLIMLNITEEQNSTYRCEVHVENTNGNGVIVESDSITLLVYGEWTHCSTLLCA